MRRTKLTFSRLIIAFNLAVPLLFFIVAGPVNSARHDARPDALHLDREQMMIFNLNRGTESAGFYMLKSLKDTKTTVRALEKANHQIEQADAGFAKSRGHGDNRYLASTQVQVKQALDTAKQLESQLSNAYDDLKVNIKQTIVREQ